MHLNFVFERKWRDIIRRGIKTDDDRSNGDPWQWRYIIFWVNCVRACPLFSPYEQTQHKQSVSSITDIDNRTDIFCSLVFFLNGFDFLCMRKKKHVFIIKYVCTLYIVLGFIECNNEMHANVSLLSIMISVHFIFICRSAVAFLGLNDDIDMYHIPNICQYHNRITMTEFLLAKPLHRKCVFYQILARNGIYSGKLIDFYAWATVESKSIAQQFYKLGRTFSLCISSVQCAQLQYASNWFAENGHVKFRFIYLLNAVTLNLSMCVSVHSHDAHVVSAYTFHTNDTFCIFISLSLSIYLFCLYFL